MARDNYKLTESFELIGAFWPYGAPDQKFTGTMTAENGKLSLNSAPEYSQIDIAEAAKRGLLGQQSHFTRIGSICGFTVENECSLLAVTHLNEGGLKDFSSGQMLLNQQYRASVAVMGLHLESVDAKIIDSACFYFTKIHEWLPTPWGMTMNNDGMTYVRPSKPREVFKFKSAALAAEIICEVFAGGETKFRTDAVIRSMSRVRVIPEHPQSLEWFISIANRIENFFALCLGTSVALNRVQFFRGSGIGWLIHKGRRRNQEVNIQLWLRVDLSSIIPTALDKWLAVPEEKRPVEKTLLGMLRKSSLLYGETEFLSLAQALEGFSRLQGGPDKGFSKRIKETYDLLTPRFAMKLVGPKAEFVRKVVDTRNLFTHLGIRPANAAVRDGGEIFNLNQRLHAFLRCVMLLQLGIPETNLHDPIAYQATRWRIF